MNQSRRHVLANKSGKRLVETTPVKAISRAKPGWVATGAGRLPGRSSRWFRDAVHKIKPHPNWFGLNRTGRSLEAKQPNSRAIARKSARCNCGETAALVAARARAGIGGWPQLEKLEPAGFSQHRLLLRHHLGQMRHLLCQFLLLQSERACLSCHRRWIGRR